MKKGKKLALAAALFSAALNLSACAYGPPNDEMELMVKNDTDISDTDTVSETEAEDTSPADEDISDTDAENEDAVSENDSTEETPENE